MSDNLLRELGLPEPDTNLNVGSGSHAGQTAEVMKRYEQWVEANPPDWCVVVGDVNSTVACALVAAKRRISLAHVEAGLRSFDRTMPEEINRVVTDSISDLLLASEPSGVANLAHEGRPSGAIHLVGNVMVDTLLRLRGRAKRMNVLRQFDVVSGGYVYLTLHRPSNVDNSESLAEICDQLFWLASQIDVVFPVHPRTREKLSQFGLLDCLTHENKIHLAEPTSYLGSLSLAMNAKLVVTDSGGLQEEAAVLNVPCLTLRENTERPITLSEGTNTLIGKDFSLFRETISKILSGTSVARGTKIPYWDGKSGRRILKLISELK